MTELIGTSTISFLEKNRIIIDLLATLGTLLTAIFAYMAAKDSRLAISSAYLPILEVKEVVLFTNGIETCLRIHVDHNSKEPTCVAKNMELFLSGTKIHGRSYEIHPDYGSGGLLDFRVEKELKEKFKANQKIFVFYEDIFRNKFILKGKLARDERNNDYYKTTTKTTYFLPNYVFYMQLFFRKIKLHLFTNIPNNIVRNYDA